MWFSPLFLFFHEEKESCLPPFFRRQFDVPGQLFLPFGCLCEGLRRHVFLALQLDEVSSQRCKNSSLPFSGEGVALSSLFFLFEK